MLVTCEGLLERRNHLSVDIIGRVWGVTVFFLFFLLA